VDLAFAGRSRLLKDSELGSFRLSESSFNLLDVLGVAVIAGRPFSLSDAAAERHVALIREEVWSSRFGRDPATIGRSIRDKTGTVEIIGVLPRDFIAPSVNWATSREGLLLSPETFSGVPRPRSGIPGLVGRLRPGVSIDDAQLSVNSMMTGLVDEGVLSPRSFVLVQSLQNGLFWNARAPLSLLYGAAAGVLLICCLNLSILVTARIEADRRQTAVRLALGASSAQILQRAIAPIAIVCGLGTLTAVLTVIVARKSLFALVPEFLRPLVLVSVDSRLVWITCLVASAGAILAALYPLKRLLRSDPKTMLQVGQELTGGRPRIFALLTGLEATMGTVLLIAGAITVGSYVDTLWTDLGYQPRAVYIVHRGDATQSQFTEVGEILQAVPGVVHVSRVDTPWGSREMPDAVKDPSGLNIRVRSVGSHYLEVYNARLLAGQSLAQSDFGALPLRAVINESAAGVWWRGVPPSAVIGRSVALPGIGEISIAGVIANTRERHAVPPSPEILLPFDNATMGTAKYVVRVTEPRQVTPDDLAGRLAQRLNQEGAVTVVPLQRALDTWLESPRLYAVVLGSFGVVSALLICVGIASVCSFDIASRRREIALRMALGGSLRGVGALFARRSLTPLGVGLLSGCLLAYWSSAFLGSLVPGLERVNIAVYVIVVVTAVVSGIGAVVSPISRAIRTAPIGVLKDN
jgi:predicted permease